MAGSAAVVASTAKELLNPTNIPLGQATLINNGNTGTSSPTNSARLTKIYTKSTPPPSSPIGSISSAKRTRSHRTISSSSSSSASAIATAATLRSNHISIVSLEDDDDDDDDGNCSSSLADSDSDLDDMSVNLSELVANGMLHKPPSTPGGTAIRSNGMIVINNGTPTEIVRSPAPGGSGGANNRPHIGSIALQNSTDITFGDKTFYQGPVTVKQFFLEKDQWRRQESNTTTTGSSHSGTVPTATAGGQANGAYVSHGDADGGTSFTNRATNPSANDSSPNNSTPESGAKLDGRTCWKKLLQLERRPLVLAVLVTLTLFFMAMIALVTYLTLLPTIGTNKTPPGDGEDSRLNGPTNSTIGNDFLLWKEIATSLVLVILVALTLFFMATIAIVTHLLLQYTEHTKISRGDGEDSRLNGPTHSTIGDDLLWTEFGTSLRIIPRVLWLAQPPRNPINDLEMPATRLIIAHTASESCETQAACTLTVRLMQTFHIESQNWDDIAYNFMVGGDGAVYVGRGWDKEGAHTRGFNKRSICIAFIGTFIDKPPPQRQMYAARMLIEEGLVLNKLSADYKLYGHRQLIASESPGEALYQVIKTWPHWTSSLSSSVGNV